MRDWKSALNQFSIIFEERIPHLFYFFGAGDNCRNMIEIRWNNDVFAASKSCLEGVSSGNKIAQTDRKPPPDTYVCQQ